MTFSIKAESSSAMIGLNYLEYTVKPTAAHALHAQMRMPHILKPLPQIIQNPHNDLPNQHTQIKSKFLVAEVEAGSGKLTVFGDWEEKLYFAVSNILALFYILYVYT